ncbi:MAG: hypothetical protein WBM98_00765, partial [Maribacter sp.]|uniref:hypothetical protein n=1 Tax=Maribacter sp. TaxID=1897614 RepID=UPI003C73433B
MMNLTKGFKKNSFRYCVKKKTILYLHPLWDTGSAFKEAGRSVLEGFPRVVWGMKKFIGIL